MHDNTNASSVLTAGEQFTLHLGDNLETLKNYPDNTFDSIVTDPPYGIEFLGKDWDSHTGVLELWQECLRVLKPGGYLLAFSAARTYHNLASNIELAGFEIRDQLMWLYASGFPKAQDIGKAIEKREGTRANAEAGGRASLERKYSTCRTCGKNNILTGDMFSCDNEICDMRVRLAPAQNEWNGFKTALKPAHEPIVMARKPFKGSTIDNVLKNGLGALNIDATRVPWADEQDAENHVINIYDNGDNLALNMETGDSAKGTYKKTKSDRENVMSAPNQGLNILRNRDVVNGVGKKKSDQEIYAASAKRYSETTPFDGAPIFQGTEKKKKSDREKVQSFEQKSFEYIVTPGITGLTPVDRRKKSERELAATSKAWGNGRTDRDGAPIFQGTEKKKKSDRPNTGGANRQKSFVIGSGDRTISSETVDNVNDGGRYPSNVIGEVEEGYQKYFYCPKVSRKERHIGFASNESWEEALKSVGGYRVDENGNATEEFSKNVFIPTIGLMQAHGVAHEVEKLRKEQNITVTNIGNNHPTVKPVALMEYLIKLVTPPSTPELQRKVLDPFMGSGSTGMAATALGHHFTGCELDPKYVAIAETRIEAWLAPEPPKQPAANERELPSELFGY